MEVLVIDNYDSFTYNLVHALEALGADVSVWRNDAFLIDDIANFDKIVLSPGPGIPDEAGLLKQVIQQYAAQKSILGICLGQQAIAEVFGGRLYNLERVFHGFATPITTIVHDEVLFDGLPDAFSVGRYHSWAVMDLPDVLQPTSVDENGTIMSLRHTRFDVRGVQFHPESILTPDGRAMLGNWLHNKFKAGSVIGC